MPQNGHGPFIHLFAATWIQLQILANALDALEANGQPRAAQVVAACFDKVCDKL